MLALLVVAATFWTALLVVEGSTGRRGPLAGPPALALVICFEAVLLNALSAARLLHLPGVALAHLVALPAIAALALRSGRLEPGRALRAPWRALGAPLLRQPLTAALLLPLFALGLLAALRHGPSNWDSMTYHLARVAYWLQDGAVGILETSNQRQNVTWPGAEYLLAVLQALSGSDRLSGLVQWGAWVATALALGPLARSLGAPRAIAWAAGPIAAGAPMATLQASTTQNDLVSAATTVAVLAACRPFWSGRRARAADLVVLAAAGAAAVLVKPTGALVALPGLLLALVGMVRALRSGRVRPRALLAGGAAAALLAVAVLGPDVARRLEPAQAAEAATYAGTFLYPALGEAGDRLANVGRALLRHLPAPAAWREALGVDRPGECQGWCLGLGALANEDHAGNPLQAGLLLLLVAGAAVQGRRLPRRVWLGVALPALGGLLAFTTLRDNPWVSRLHLPALCLVGLALGVIAGPARRGPRAARALAGALALAAVAQGAWAMMASPRDPLAPAPFLRDEAEGYYTHLPALRGPHQLVLSALGQTGCRRLGLVLGGDSYDYPLTWPAMELGVEVRHVRPGHGWPCLIFTDQPLQPGASLGGWRPTSAPFLLVNTTPP